MSEKKHLTPYIAIYHQRDLVMLRFLNFRFKFTAKLASSITGFRVRIRVRTTGITPCELMRPKDIEDFSAIYLCVCFTQAPQSLASF